MTVLYVPDTLFPHTKDLEIPKLDITKQAKFYNLPIRGWDSTSRRGRFRGTWHFYVDDRKFTALWKHPESILKTKAISCVECNFSTDYQMPYPVVLYRVFQKRWLARYWQECGLEIFVDLNVADNDNWYKLNFEGVPKGWRSYATSASSSRLEVLQRQADIAKYHAEGEKLRFLVYGGGKKVAEMCAENDWVHVRDARNESRENIDG